MAPSEKQYQFLQHGIAVMTAWSNDPDGHDFPAAVIWDIISEHGEPDLIIGLINLAGALLTKLEKETGQTADQVLQDVAQRYRPEQ